MTEVEELKAIIAEMEETIDSQHRTEAGLLEVIANRDATIERFREFVDLWHSSSYRGLPLYRHEESELEQQLLRLFNESLDMGFVANDGMGADWMMDDE